MANFVVIYWFYPDNKCTSDNVVYKITKTGQRIKEGPSFGATEGTVHGSGSNYLIYMDRTATLKLPNETVVGDYLDYTEASLNYAKDAFVGSGDLKRSIYPRKDDRGINARETIAKFDDKKTTMTWTWSKNNRSLPASLKDDEVTTETFTKQ